MEKEKLVTVIVPVHNMEAYLRPCLESILGQTYQAMEILLVEDGSTDQSAAICQEYEKRDGRIRMICQDNQGLSAARNRGLEAAAGEYVSFVDADDRIVPWYLEYLVRGLEECDVKMAVCDYMPCQMKEPLWKKQPAWESCKYVKMANDEVFAMAATMEQIKFVVSWGAVYRKELFEYIWFDEGKIHEDEFIFHRIYDRAPWICYVDLKMYFYTIRWNSLSKRNGNFRPHVDKVEALTMRALYLKEQGKERELLITARDILSQIIAVYDDAENKRAVYELFRKRKRLMEALTGRGKLYPFADLFAVSPGMFCWLRRGGRLWKKVRNRKKQYLDINFNDWEMGGKN